MVLGRFSAPVFMLAMGIDMRYSRHNTVHDHARRGLILLIIGTLLNIVCYTVPRFISHTMNGGYDLLYYIVGTNAIDPLTGYLITIFSVDILQFAGLAFIFMALMKKLRLSDWSILAIALIFSFVAIFTRDFMLDSFLIDRSLDFLYSEGPRVYFPLASWLIFPAVGYMFADYLIRCKELCSVITDIRT